MLGEIGPRNDTTELKVSRVLLLLLPAERAQSCFLDFKVRWREGALIANHGKKWKKRGGVCGLKERAKRELRSGLFSKSLLIEIYWSVQCMCFLSFAKASRPIILLILPTRSSARPFPANS